MAHFSLFEVSVFSDLRYSTRSLTQTPGVAAALILTIAVGIGSNAALYGFVSGVVSRDLPIADLDRVVSIAGTDADGSLGPISYDEFLSLQSYRDHFEWVGAAREAQSTIRMNDRSSITPVAAVTPEIAALLQISPTNGAVVSHRLRQNDLRPTSKKQTETLHIDADVVTVVGDAPEWLEGLYLGRPIDVWMPMDAAVTTDADRTSPIFWVMARLRNGISIERAQAAIDASHRGAGTLEVLPYTGMTPNIAAGLSRIGALLRAAAAAVFFIACANVVCLLLSRAWTRSRETAVRVALGARRAQLARQLLADSVVITVSGGAAGVALATWTMRAVPLLFYDQDAAHLIFEPNFADILIASATCVAITVACGLVPLFEMRADRPATVLQRENAGPSQVMRRLRMGLVVAQIALCCVLIIATARLLEGFREALEVNMVARSGVPVLASIQSRPRATRSETTSSGLTFFSSVEEVTESLNGAIPRAWVAALPGGSPTWQQFRVEPSDLPTFEIVLDVRRFTAASLPEIVLPPVSGRLFSGQDTPRACRVAIVNTEAADEVFGADAVGRSLDDPSNQKVEIVGVVAMRQPEKRAIPDRPAIYYYDDQGSMPVAEPGPGRFRVAARPPDVPFIALDVNIVSASYFRTMGWTVERGRLFADDLTPGCRVAVINQETERRYFGGDALGAAVTDRAGRRTEIVGVVQAVPAHALQRRVEPAIYFPMAQDFLSGMTLILNATDASDSALTGLRRRLEALPGRGPSPVIVRTFQSHLSRTALAPLRISTTLIGASAAMAIALGVIGLYAAMTDSTHQRRREIAVRIALGAPGWRVIRRVVLDGVRLAGAGTLVGLLGSSLLLPSLRRFMPTDEPVSPWVWLAGPAILIAAVALASGVPARRAATVSPLTLTRGGN